MTDPYKVLGVDRNASDEEVKKAYLALARKYHPDKYTDTDLAELAAEKMKEVNAAYDAIQQERANRSAQSEAGGGYSDYQGSADSRFAYIRRLINAGDIVGAQARLDEIPVSDRGAEWCFLMGCVAIKGRRYADAALYFDEACRQDPRNMEYRMARDNLRRQAENYGSWETVRNSGAGDTCCYCGDGCDCCSSLLCADCFCECCGGDLIPGC